MKSRSPLVLAAVITAIFLALSALAQGADTPTQHYLTLDYMKPLPGKSSEYVQMEIGSWKAVHQARVAAGNIVSWKLYSAHFPNGDSLEYQYITVTEYPSWAALENSYQGINLNTILGEGKGRELRTASAAIRTIVRQDTLSVYGATDNFSSSANTLLSVHFMKALPGKSNDLMQVQLEYFLPANNAVAKANGGASSWAGAVVRYPSNADRPYGHVSFNGSASYTQMDAKWPADIMKIWNPKYVETYGPLLQGSRTKVRNELWRLVDQTQAKK
jgi:hypothetical protein